MILTMQPGRRVIYLHPIAQHPRYLNLDLVDGVQMLLTVNLTVFLINSPEVGLSKPLQANLLLTGSDQLFPHPLRLQAMASVESLKLDGVLHHLAGSPQNNLLLCHPNVFLLEMSTGHLDLQLLMREYSLFLCQGHLARLPNTFDLSNQVPLKGTSHITQLPHHCLAVAGMSHYPGGILLLTMMFFRIFHHHKHLRIVLK